MKINLTSLSLQYTANFRTPFFRIADARSAVLETLYRAFASRYAPSPNEIFGFGGNSLSDQRVRMNLFRGNAFVEITAQKVYASFSNAAGKADTEIIEDCVSRLLGAMEAFAADSPLGDEQIILYPTVEVESEEVRDKFLKSLPPPMKLPTFVSTNQAIVWPIYKIEMEHPTKEWMVDIAIQRAWGLPRNLFVSAHADFFTGARSDKVADRSKILGDAVGSVFESLGLEGKA